MVQLRWPLDNTFRTITTRYGEPSLFGPHPGIDISVPSGNRVYATHAGSVEQESTDAGGLTLRLTGGRWVSRCCHLSRYVVRHGAWVNQGDVVAMSGNTGVTTGPHLHFELFLNGSRVDPLAYLEQEAAVARKIGIHIQTFADWMPGVVGTHWKIPQWVKMINPPVPDAFPNTRILGRAWIKSNNDAWEADLVKKGAAGGVEYFNALYDFYNRRRGIVTAWEGPNEPNVSTVAAATSLREFTYALAERVLNAGLKPCGGSISVGNPKVSKYDGTNAEWLTVAQGLSRCTYWSYHGYWQRPYDPVDDWWAHRYRLLISEASAAGISLPPLLISETGADIAGGENDGWKVQYGGDFGAYLVDIQRYTDELEKDRSVQMAALFTAGAEYRWRNFGLDQLQTIEIGKYAAGGASAQPVEGLPEHEPSQNPAIIAEKMRWWLEEMERQYQSGNTAYAQRIRLSLIQLGYRLERILKNA